MRDIYTVIFENGLRMRLNRVNNRRKFERRVKGESKMRGRGGFVKEENSLGVISARLPVCRVQNSVPTVLYILRDG